MNISLASIIATVEGYFSRNIVGMVPFTCSVDGYQISWLYKKQTQVIKYVV